ncbi:MAG: nucleotide pyrophosphohydrolase [Archaeoglobaceae archaeon]
MDLEGILNTLRDFRDKRDWLKFHTPKNLATSIVIEACELLELFQWTRSLEEEKEVLESRRQEIAEEVADIFIYLLFFCDIANLDLERAVKEKMLKNESRFRLD